MKNNIKKARVKVRDDLLFFFSIILYYIYLLLYMFLSLPQISDYHHLKVVIITNFWAKTKINIKC